VNCNSKNKIADNCINCAVAKLSVFGDMTKEEMNAIEGYIEKKRHYDKGEILIDEHDSVSYSLCVNSGYLILGSYLPNGSRQIYRVTMPGDSIGFSHKQQNTNYFVQAITDVDVCVINNDTVKDLLAKAPQVALRLVEVLANDSETYQHYLLNSSRKDATQSLAYLILDISDKIKNIKNTCAKNKEAQDFFPLNQEDMADVAGLTKVHVSRVISQFKIDGLVKCSHKTMTILDRDKLSDIGSYP